MLTKFYSINDNNKKTDLHFDFHIHSKYSFDSLLQPQQIIKIALKRGLDGIAITDHSTIKGGVLTAKLSKSNLKIIIGCEINTNKGDIIGIFLNDEINKTEFHEVVDEIKSQDGLVILPHPYKMSNRIPIEIIKNVDIIEITNGRIKHKLNEKAKKLAIKNKIPIVGGSDAHLAREIGVIQTVYNNCNIDDFSDVSAFRKLIKEIKPEIIGDESPRNVHYFSAIIGNLKKKQPLKLGKSIIKKMKSKAY